MSGDCAGCGGGGGDDDADWWENCCGNKNATRYIWIIAVQNSLFMLTKLID